MAAVCAAMMAIGFAACSDDEPYVLTPEDIKVEEPAGGFTVEVGQELNVTVNSVSDEGLSYKWYLDNELISTSKDLRYIFDEAGEYDLQLVVTQYDTTLRYNFHVKVTFGGITPPSTGTPYITKVLDFMPAVGQFTNTMPAYVEGDTQETMNQKVLAAIGNNNKKVISLGGYGGYVTVGFDHTIENREGLRDFRVLGNSFYSVNSDPNSPEGGSFEPGIIMVAYDKNHNGMPDEDEWYEIAGSAQVDPIGEPWYNIAKEHGNNMNLYKDYEITYFRPAKEPETAEEAQYIRWEDNKGNSGYRAKNAFHDQSYFPQWFKGDKLIFRGTCLPQNCVKEGNDYIRYKFRYGYADNEINTKDDSAIDIDWAVNAKGQKVHLPGVDFIKIYTGVNQENEWIGECSTEVSGIEDLHLLGVKIATR